MRPLSLVFTSELHFPFVCGFIFRFGALLIADLVMSFVTVDFEPVSSKGFVVELLHLGNIRAAAELKASIDGGNNGGSCK